ncbi:MAG: chromate transporter [Bacillota bacterium]
MKSTFPSIIIIIIIFKLFHKFSENKYIISFLNGARPVIVRVIFSVGIDFILSCVFKIKEITDIRSIYF